MALGGGASTGTAALAAHGLSGVRLVETLALGVSADECADHPDPGYLLAQHLGDAVNLDLHGPELWHHRDHHDAEDQHHHRHSHNQQQ